MTTGPQVGKLHHDWTASGASDSRVPPHTRRVEKLLALLATTIERGLDAGEVSRRRALHGPNVIEDHSGRGVWTMWREQFTDRMVLMLIGAAILAGYVGEAQDTVA